MVTMRDFDDTRVVLRGRRFSRRRLLLGKVSEMTILLIVLLMGGIFGFLHFLDYKQEKANEQRWIERQETLLSDENVLKEQRNFEKRLDENANLPDGIVWSKAYVYRHLMSRWYSMLIARHRYDQEVARKLKGDWLDYMGLLESSETAFFLSLESKVEARGNYEEEALQERLRYMAIENAFAAAIGDHAVEQLERVRKAPTGAFDRSGKKPMAPEGFSYSLISLRPYEEELKPNSGWEEEAHLKANAPPKNVVGELEKEIKESVVEVELERDIKKSVDGEYGSPPWSRSWNAL
jgi:hypothetical protein